MAHDYFQDITPPNGGGGVSRRFTPRPAPTSEPPPVAEGFDSETQVPIRVPSRESEASVSSPPATDPSVRGIRNISAPLRVRPRLDPDMRQAPIGQGMIPPKPRRRFSHLWIWVLAGVSCLVLASLFLFAFRSTTVTVIPKSKTAVLAGTSPVIAIRAGQLAENGTLTYTVEVSDLEDSEVVSAQGTTHAETKASGSITAYNNYSSSPVRLVKNTRFESPGGLIFRVPADVVIPGKSGSTPGHIAITVIADQVGEKYNIPATSRFTLPGLKSTKDMYAGVYAKSTGAMTGGFSGERAGTARGALTAAVAQVRGRLETKARDAARAKANDTSVIFPELIAVAYQSLPSTTEAGGGVRIHEKAHVEVPVFVADSVAAAIARAAGANADGAPVSYTPSSDFAVHTAASSTEKLGDTINFAFSGSALIVWKVDIAALQRALAGRDAAAFQGIVNGFASIQEAHARIEPFWKSTFPANASDIKVSIMAPQAAQ